jgi:sialic acid synthase SpsE
MQYETTIRIAEREISLSAPTYFIADIASNHDGSLERAKDLIWLAKEAGADCAKFQHFLASKIVSHYGFSALKQQVGHQAQWDKPVYEVYKAYETNRAWNDVLAETAKAAGIHFMTTPYDFEAIDTFVDLMPAYKVGSGDITWTEALERIAAKGKPVLLATGAADMVDVERAVSAILKHGRQLLLMQCNTNYTGSVDNFSYVNLHVLKSFALHYPGMPLGLSDHTPGHAAVLGAVTLGARAIEKHFTDDNSRNGPDHGFAINPKNWHEMVDRTRELELALGDGVKRVERNERDTLVVQRRCLRLTMNRQAGDFLAASDLEPLRPAPAGAVHPYDQQVVLGRKLRIAKVAGDALYYSDLDLES